MEAVRMCAVGDGDGVVHHGAHTLLLLTPPPSSRCPSSTMYATLDYSVLQRASDDLAGRGTL